MTFNQHKPVWEPAHLWLLETQNQMNKSTSDFRDQPTRNPGKRTLGAQLPSETQRKSLSLRECAQGKRWRTALCMMTWYGLLWTTWSIHLSIFLTDYPFLTYRYNLCISGMSLFTVYYHKCFLQGSYVLTMSFPYLLPMSCNYSNLLTKYLTSLEKRKFSLQLLLSLSSLRKVLSAKN